MDVCGRPHTVLKETHDGGPGTEDRFGYGILYLAPELVRGALRGRAQPLVADPV
jgi:hypothetical protein